MPSVSVQVQVDEAVKALEGTSKSVRSISRQVVGIAARTTVKAIKGAIKASTARRTGDLLKAYGYKVRKDGTSASVWPKNGTDRRTFIKANALSYGTIKGIQPRGFIQAGKAFAESGAYMPEVQKAVDKTLDKYWG